MRRPNQSFRDRMDHRAVLVIWVFIPLFALIVGIALTVMYMEGVSMVLAILFIALAYCAGWAGASMRMSNIDAELARAGDIELHQYKTLIDMELQYRGEPVPPPAVALKRKV